MDDQLVETMLGMQVILALERKVDPAVGAQCPHGERQTTPPAHAVAG